MCDFILAAPIQWRWKSHPAGLGAILGAFGIVLALFWIWMLIDCIGQRMPTWGKKTFWVALILVLPVIGAAIYWFTIRKPDSQRRAATM